MRGTRSRIAWNIQVDDVRRRCVPCGYSENGRGVFSKVARIEHFPARRGYKVMPRSYRQQYMYGETVDQEQLEASVLSKSYAHCTRVKFTAAVLSWGEVPERAERTERAQDPRDKITEKVYPLA